jgi:hopene-associated glycosyltransferase HpnB
MMELMHPHVANALGIIALAIWLHLFFGRGWFWRIRKLDADAFVGKARTEWPRIVVVVPARNEAETIEATVTGLVRQDYSGEFSVVVVDDHSDDATATLVRQVADQNHAGDRVRVTSASALSESWTGKLWALNEGVAADAAEEPTYYWFTDADVSHAPDTLRRLVVRAEEERLDLASLMVLLQAKSLPERALIPAFLYFFLMLYPPKWIADEELSTAGAAGGCILIRRKALERIGGLAAIRSEVIDDCALAKAVKLSGGKVWMGLTRKSTSLRAYGTFGEFRARRLPNCVIRPSSWWGRWRACC